MDARPARTADGYDSLPSQRSPAAVKIDNLIRRTLRVSNPYDPREVAAGLERFYPAATERLRQEEQGLPFFRFEAPRPAALDGEGPSEVELRQARDDAGRDLDSLIHNSLLKDIQPELRGWQSAVEGLVEEGSHSARLGLDPRQRDRTFAIRRTLGDYARAARFVGALTPTLNLNYRRFAQSLDEISSVLMIMLGDSLARVGFGSGRFLLQVPASELQERREAVLNALRHMLGLVGADLRTQEEFPRAMHAYQTLLSRLDASGNSDLRVLFQENYLAQLMDELIARAATPSADGLRALGSTATVAVQQLRRMVQISGRLVDPDSPPLKFFLIALQLFYDAFSSTSSGFRLLFISRPTISFYGLYGLGRADVATRRLQDLIFERSNLAQLLDCYLACNCDDQRIRYQVLFDKILYDLDRAIDYYALGSNPQGQAEPERRAATFGLLARELLNQVWAGPRSPLDVQGALLHEEIDRYDPIFVQQHEDRLNRVLSTLNNLGHQNEPTHVDVIESIWNATNLLLAGINVARVNFRRPLPRPGAVATPAAGDVRADPEVRNMMQELCLQRDLEEQWTSLLHTMTPSCTPPSDLQELTTGLLDVTRIRYFGRLLCPPVLVTIPPTLATSAAGDIFDENSEGGRGD